jgi:hypothetical protein
MKEKRKIWQYPWAYKESFIIVFTLMLIGLALDLLIGKSSINMEFPINIIAFAVLLDISVMLYWLSKKFRQLRFFFSIEATIGSVILFTIFTMLLALVPEQEFIKLGFDNIRNTFSFAFAYSYFLIILGCTVLFRIKMKSLRDVAFFLNHFGLWFTLVAMGLGSADIKHWTMPVAEGETVWYAYNEEGIQQTMDFAIELNEFNIEYFEPKYAILDIETRTPLKKNNKPLVLEIEKEKPFKFENYELTLMNYVPAPKFEPGGKMENLQPNKGYFLITKDGTAIDSGWVSSGNEFMPPVGLEFSNKYSLVMSEPEPSIFESDAKIFEKEGESYASKITVNNPHTIGKYKIYQTSYEKSPTGYISILTVIYEPWLIYSYIGSIMLILGSGYLIFSRIDLGRE